MRVLARLIAVLGVLLALPAGAQTRQVGIGDLHSTYWVLTEWNGMPTKFARTPTLSFNRANDISGWAACNRFDARYSLIGPIVVINAALAKSPACDDEQTNTDRRFTADLGGLCASCSAAKECSSPTTQTAVCYSASAARSATKDTAFFEWNA